MHQIQFLLCCVFLIFAGGCQPAITEVDVSTINTAQLPSVVFTKMPVSQTATENPLKKDSDPTRENTNMPVFLEVIQTTVINEQSSQNPAIVVGPRIYFYDPDHKILELNPKITLKSGTELFVGVAQILQTSKQTYENQEIIQYPHLQPAIVQIVAHDVTTDTLTIVFAGESFDLTPGENRTFKQPGAEPEQSMVILTISNHGRLTEIQTLPLDGSLR